MVAGNRAVRRRATVDAAADVPAVAKPLDQVDNPPLTFL
jgi:hypothetical protein